LALVVGCADGRRRPEIIVPWRLPTYDSGAIDCCYFPQSQLFPQLHSLLSFKGQFLPVLAQFGLSAARDIVQIAATRIENMILV
jgi:hypothetical protein